jgi:thiamine-phosphate pyrophosphorylase
MRAFAATGFRTDGVHGFYPIVDRAERVAWLVGLGVRTVQLRCKDLHGAVLRDELARALDAAAAVDAQLVINDAWREALDLGASWVHLGQTDLDDADVGALRAAGVGIGVSSHSPGERMRAVALGPAYVALGPIWETPLKRMPFAPQGLARVAAWKAALGDLPLVAIGGVTLERAPQVLDAGADAVAVVTDLLRPDADDRVRAWLDLFSSQPRRPAGAPT